MKQRITNFILIAALPLLIGAPSAHGAPDALFVIRGAISETQRDAIEKAAIQARADLQKQWPRPLSNEPLMLEWFSSSDTLARRVKRNVNHILALAHKSEDAILLNGPVIRRSDIGELRRTLLHEMVHINLARAKVYRLPRWLEEGLAMRLAGERRWSDSWRLAGDRLFGRLRSPDEIWGRWPDSPDFEDRAYRQAASLTNYLLERHFPRGGERQLLAILLSPGRSDAFIDTLWQPAVRRDLYAGWLDQGSRLGAIIGFLSGSTMLFGGFGVVLLVWAWLVRRRRARAVEEEWRTEGPYFS